MKENKRKKEKKIKKVINKPIIQEMINTMASETDPNGSYTGVPNDIDVIPVQDADDL